MRLNFIFLLIDILILVVYPFAFLWGKMRQIFKVKRQFICRAGDHCPPSCSRNHNVLEVQYAVDE